MKLVMDIPEKYENDVINYFTQSLERALTEICFETPQTRDIDVEILQYLRVAIYNATLFQEVKR